MTKAELINAVAQKTELSKKDSEKAVVAVLDAISETLAAGEKVAPERASIRAPRRRSRSRLPSCLSSKQARRSRKLSLSKEKQGFHRCSSSGEFRGCSFIETK